MIPDEERLRLEADGTAWLAPPNCYMWASLWGWDWQEGRWEVVGDGLIHVFSVDRTPTPATGSWVEGQVGTVVEVIFEGAPLPGATVVFECPDGERSTVSDREGIAHVDCLPNAARFHLYGFHAARWERGRHPVNRLRAELESGYESEYDELWAMGTGGELRHVGDRLTADGESTVEARRVPPRRLATARVHFEERSLAGAEVTFHCDRGEVTTSTDSRGMARAEGCLALAVEVSRAGFLPVAYEVEDEDEGINFFDTQLAPDLAAPDPELIVSVASGLYVDEDAYDVFDDFGSVYGHFEEDSQEIVVEITDDDGEPIAGAEVTVHCESGPAGATTGLDGSARVAGCVVDGLEVTAEGRLPVRYGVEPGEAENEFQIWMAARPGSPEG